MRIRGGVDRGLDRWELLGKEQVSPKGVGSLTGSERVLQRLRLPRAVKPSRAKRESPLLRVRAPSGEQES